MGAFGVVISSNLNASFFFVLWKWSLYIPLHFLFVFDIFEGVFPCFPDHSAEVFFSRNSFFAVKFTIFPVGNKPSGTAKGR